LKRKIITLLLIIAIVFNLSGCSKKNERYQAQFLELFDTVTTIVGYAKDKDTFTKYAEMVYDNLKTYHELYDKYNDYEGINNIKTINDNAGIAPVKVDQKIIDLLLFAKDAYELSDGEMNVAYGAVLEVWHDYREIGTEEPDKAEVPPIELLEEKAKHTDISKVIIDDANNTVYLEDPDMSLDVGGVAKGYATEQVSQIVKENGMESMLLSVGGNIRAIGGRDNKEPWSVGIQNPDLESDEQYVLITQVEDLSVVSSGDYERYYTVNGKRYHHIIDPDTLMPADYFREVSIICMDSGLADVLSTTLFNIPMEDGLKLVESLEGTEAMWVAKDGEVTYSTGFERYIKE
jgi:FAD:protein FMN transferase